MDLPGPEIDRLRKQIVEVFAEHHLKITVEVNVRSTDFLDVMFDLENSSYKPYRKDVSPPIYINSESNHPRHIKKGLPEMIGRRVSDLSANKDVFSAEIPIYKNALRNAGYENELEYTESNTRKQKNRRRRKVLWFNPPWNDEVSTNVAKKFLVMIDKHFPKNSKFNKYFNRNSIKVSYCTMPNMKCLLAGVNTA